MRQSVVSTFHFLMSASKDAQLSKELKGLAKLDNIVREHVIIMLVECSWTFHVVDRSGQIGQHCSPTNSIHHKLSAVYVVLAAVLKCMVK